MRDLGGAKAGLWACVAMLACLVSGCPDTSTGVDAAGDLPTPQDLANDLTIADVDDGGMDAVVDAPSPRDLGSESAADVAMDAADAPTVRCTPGMSIACAC